jgi:signal transduction histidine kinase
MHATAHDMKNSISVLSGALERLLAAPASDAAAQGAPAYPQLAHMLYQTKRLNDNLMQMLGLVQQVGTAAYPMNARPVALGRVVDRVVAQERALLASRGIKLELDYDPEQVWPLDADLIVGVLAQAINNAIHYTGDTIRLAVRETDGWLELRVEDNGPGYPPTLLKAGTQVSGGPQLLSSSAGLGLYFSNEVAKMHRRRDRWGSVHLENGHLPGGQAGGRFVLRLP